MGPVYGLSRQDGERYVANLGGFMTHRPFIVGLSLVLSAGVGAQDLKKTITAEDAKRFENLGQYTISADGRWFAYTVSLVDGDGRLVIRNCDDARAAEVPVGSRPVFSDDSQWIAYTISPPRDAVERARQQRQPAPRARLGVRNLDSGQERVIEDVSNWALTKGGWLLIHGFGQTEPVRSGGDLVVQRPDGLRSRVIGNVQSYALNDGHTAAALVIESASGNKGVQVLSLGDSPAAEQLYWGKDAVRGLSWSPKANAFVFMTAKADPKKDGDNHQLTFCRPGAGEWIATSLDPSKADGFPAGMRITDLQPVRVAEDGTSVAFGIQPWTDKVEDRRRPEDRPGVEVWHWRDVEPMPLQSRRADQKRRESDLMLWSPASGKLTRLTEGLPGAAVLPGHRFALVADPKPYLTSIQVGGLNYQDWWVIDVEKGDRWKLAERTNWPVARSQTGKFALTYRDRGWYLTNLETRQTKPVPTPRGVQWENTRYDGPMEDTPFARMPVWMVDDQAVLLADNFDYFRLNPTTMDLTRITEGRENGLILNVLDFGFDERGLRLGDPMYFTVRDDVTKQSGIYRKQPNGDGAVLIYDDAAIGGLVKSKNTDRVVWTMSTWEKPRNAFLTNLEFSQSKPLTNVNPFLSEYHWGKTQLVQYESPWGVPLQGILIYPADYREGRQYPMVTYIYERLSDGLHQFSNPAPWQAYNDQWLSQNGYFVFKPDIAYRKNNPGLSAVECLEAAVSAVKRLHVGVDPHRIGLMGHSWGGYQTVFVLTQTNTFKVGVAGAPLTELFSMYNSFYWNSGNVNQTIFESSQGRFQKPWWELEAEYRANSPLQHMENIKSPLMVAFGTQDGAVDWHQGIYLYNTMRRMGKDLIMLVYEGENHGLARRPNQQDYADRVRHYLDVHLKFAKPQPWVTDGVPFLKKDQAPESP